MKRYMQKEKAKNGTNNNTNHSTKKKEKIARNKTATTTPHTKAQ
jgi:hypothetical protein